MFNKLLTKFVGSTNERALKRMQPRVEQINALDETVRPLDDAQLADKHKELRTRFDQGASLEDLLPEAFAVVREAGRRVLQMRHFDVQLIGGIVLHDGMIAEMKTGEGKTLVATLPAYLNALAGQGVHIVTVNDYLARRDSEWMGRIYRFLGLSVGVIQHDMSDQQRQEAYRADITYCTNNELGFDYLRDNMKFTTGAMVQRGHHFAIVDEVDSILIDEARTPLIISGPSEESVDKYYKLDKVIPRLEQGAVIQGGKEYELEDSGDYVVDEKAKTVTLTDAGVEKCQKILGVDNLFDPAQMEVLHGVQQSLKAHVLFKRDVDYMVKDGQVVIVDEFTGRLMPGRRWSDGLHQAVEAKEGVKIERENQTLATITFQNYFRMYEKLAGMTGTADTEAAEFDKIYDLAVRVIPTNRDLIRIENPDVVYRSADEKWTAVAGEIADCQERGQPTLVGTVSIEKSEKLSGILRRRGIKHVVLNAKYHQKEAEIVAQAGRVGAVTIATNMAGRGTDILLGGNPEFLARQELARQGVKPGDSDETAWDAAYGGALEQAREQCRSDRERVLEAGGLHIIGTERHESRRIDNQLRGRAGRQGDPGSSRFFLSLEDDLMRIFATETVQKLMEKLWTEEGTPIESPMVSRSIERAQKTVEARNFETRKHLLEYDDVNNKQRQEIYGLRREILEGKEQKTYLVEVSQAIVGQLVDEYIGSRRDPTEWDADGFRQQIHHMFGIELDPADPAIEELELEAIEPAVWEKLERHYAAKEERVGAPLMRRYEGHILMQIIDAAWKDHLLAMDHLKEGIGLRAYGQRDPLVEYKRESFEMFGQMKDRIETEAVRFLFRLEPMTEEEQRQEREKRQQEQERIFSAASRSKAGVAARGGVATVKREVAKVGRNAPCPCGSGKKYKKCHGAA